MPKVPTDLTRIDLEKLNNDLAILDEDQKIDLSTHTLKNMDLTNLSLKHFNLENQHISLEGCILDKDSLNFLQCLGRKNFQKIIMQNQDLGLNHTFNQKIGIAFNQGFYFDELDLSGAIFKNCNLNQATFKECNLTNVTLENCSNLEHAFSINCIQQGINVAIAEYQAPPAQPLNKFFSLLSKIISLQFLSNMLGDGNI